MATTHDLSKCKFELMTEKDADALRQYAALITPVPRLTIYVGNAKRIELEDDEDE